VNYSCPKKTIKTEFGILYDEVSCRGRIALTVGLERIRKQGSRPFQGNIKILACRDSGIPWETLREFWCRIPTSRRAMLPTFHGVRWLSSYHNTTWRRSPEDLALIRTGWVPNKGLEHHRYASPMFKFHAVVARILDIKFIHKTT